MKTLNDLLPGELGVIVTINTLQKIKRRLMDMGIIEGVEIEMIRTAPLGDPVEIKVHNTLVALRKSEAATIALDHIGVVIHGRKRSRHRFGRKS